MSKLNKTILITGPKRAGKTLLLRLFDSHPDVMFYHNESFFWEHVYRFDLLKSPELFLKFFKVFPVEDIFDGLLSREVLSCIDGKYRQYVSRSNSFLDQRINFDVDIFKQGLSDMPNINSVADLWAYLCGIYGMASGRPLSAYPNALMMSGDSGQGIIALNNNIDSAYSLFVVRNPLKAIESLKVSRYNRGAKKLHAFNLVQIVSYYKFIVDNIDQIMGPKTLLVRYEDLVTNTRETVLDVCHFCELGFDEVLLATTLDGKSWNSNSSFHSRGWVDGSRLESEIRYLSEHELRFISEELNDFFLMFGYAAD
jgi:hypothetical protein